MTAGMYFWICVILIVGLFHINWQLSVIRKHLCGKAITIEKVEDEE